MGCCQEEKLENATAEGKITKARFLEIMEGWIHNTDEGKEWLVRMATDVGVPVQLTLPFERKD